MGTNEKLFNIEYFYAGRIYEHFLNEQSKINDGSLKYINFNVPRNEKLNIVKIKSILIRLIGDKMFIKFKICPQLNSWSVRISLKKGVFNNG